MLAVSYERTMRNAKPALRSPAQPETSSKKEPPVPVREFGLPKHVCRLMGAVAAWHGLTIADLRGRSRVSKVTKARGDAMAAIYLNCRWRGRRYPMRMLSGFFNRSMTDNTTVYHYLGKRGIVRSRPRDLRRG
jgi:hypothetical protein